MKILRKCLKGSKTFFSKDIPHGLPPIRGIEQKIDSIPRAPFALITSFFAYVVGSQGVKINVKNVKSSTVGQHPNP
ncbi:hypothetical protein CR513_46516, partial [Mucuna pruriens]